MINWTLTLKLIDLLFETHNGGIPGEGIRSFETLGFHPGAFKLSAINSIGINQAAKQRAGQHAKGEESQFVGVDISRDLLHERHKLLRHRGGHYLINSPH